MHETYDASSVYWHDRAASHLMMQGTFGPTRDGIAAISAATQQGASSDAAVEKWVLDQMALPPTAHREFYRQRANARLDAPSEVGVPRSACSANSRWNAIALRADDQALNVTFSEVPIPNDADGATVTAMYVDGVLRSEVDLARMRPYGLGEPEDWSEGRNCNWCQDGGVELDKPYVWNSRKGFPAVGSLLEDADAGCFEFATSSKGDETPRQRPHPPVRQPPAALAFC